MNTFWKSDFERGSEKKYRNRKFGESSSYRDNRLSNWGGSKYPNDFITEVSKTRGPLWNRQRNITVKLTLTIVNLCNANLSTTIFSSSSGSVRMKEYEGTARFNEPVNSIGLKDKITNFTIEYKVVNSISRIGLDDHVMLVVNDIPKGANGDKTLIQ